MKFEFELPDNQTNDKMLFLCGVKTPSTIAYLNVYEKGDVWVKIAGCDECPIESREICCKGCEMISDSGCLLHTTLYARGSKKPFSCITIPSPEKHVPYCKLTFKSLSGSKNGKIRRVSKPGNIFE